MNKSYKCVATNGTHLWLMFRTSLFDLFKCIISHFTDNDCIHYYYVTRHRCLRAWWRHDLRSEYTRLVLVQHAQSCHLVVQVRNVGGQTTLWGRSHENLLMRSLILQTLKNGFSQTKSVVCILTPMCWSQALWVNYIRFLMVIGIGEFPYIVTQQHLFCRANASLD